MTISTLPPYRIETCIQEKREPGMVVFNVRPSDIVENSVSRGWIIGIDQAGENRLNLEFNHPTQDIRVLPNGNLLFSLTSAGILIETTMTGDEVSRWHVAGKWRDKEPPKDSIAIDAELTHHSINVFPNGNFLLLSAEVREFPNWPKNDDDPNAAKGKSKVVGDVVLEVSRDGHIENTWHILDIIDPYRLSYGSCQGYWNNRGFTDSNDWCHANSAIYDVRDDTIIVSLRTQDCLIKFKRNTSELKWILGDPGNWREPWALKLLKPVGTLNWQYHQHDCSVTPDGTILCFDNGNFRSVPFKEKMPAEKSYSRAVEFDVDEEAMTVRQTWAYGEEANGKVFACYQGGAYRLPQTGNTFINYGGVCTKGGIPVGTPSDSFCKARLIEVTPDHEVVFDMWIYDVSAENALPLSSFRSEFVPIV